MIGNCRVGRVNEDIKGGWGLGEEGASDGGGAEGGWESSKGRWAYVWVCPKIEREERVGGGGGRGKGYGSVCLCKGNTSDYEGSMLPTSRQAP